MKIHHWYRLNRLTRNYRILEDLTKIYSMKVNEYSIRDMKLGKAVSLISPKEQEERAINVIEIWYKKLNRKNEL